MIKKRYKTPMAKFHKLNPSAVLVVVSKGELDNDTTPFGIDLHSATEEELDQVPITNKGLQW